MYICITVNMITRSMGPKPQAPDAGGAAAARGRRPTSRRLTPRGSSRAMCVCIYIYIYIVYCISNNVVSAPSRRLRPISLLRLSLLRLLESNFPEILLRLSLAFVACLS